MGLPNLALRYDWLSRFKYIKYCMGFSFNLKSEILPRDISLLYPLTCFRPTLHWGTIGFQEWLFCGELPIGTLVWLPIVCLLTITPCFLSPTTKIRVLPGVSWCWEVIFSTVAGCYHVFNGVITILPLLVRPIMVNVTCQKWSFGRSKIRKAS